MKLSDPHTSMDDIPILSTESLHLRAARHLRTMIIDGRLAPNSPIDERSLCEQFGTSRTPLREALKVLASEGLIELLPRRGAIVASISVTDMREKFEVVRMIESFAARRVCDSATDAQIKSLLDLHRKLIAAHKKRDPGLYFELNEQFHREVVETMGNRTLIDMHASLVAHLRRARRIVLGAKAQIPQFVKHHERIIKAIRERKGEVAAREFTLHQEAIEHETVSFFGSSPGSMKYPPP